MISGISNLYSLKSSNPQKAMAEACREFETMFSYQLLKTMGTTVEKDGMLGEGIGGEMYNDMMYMEVARSAASGRGIGIADVLINQIRTQVAGNGQDIKATGEVTDK